MMIAPMGETVSRASQIQVLVSCIMPTFNRRRFVPHAIRYFLRQDYPQRELIILDDGTDPVRDLVPDDPRIRYVRLEARRSVGAKRNLACQEARGEIIVHWDDDDWMADWRLSYQVASLLDGQADLCGLDRVFFYDPLRGQAWQYIYPERRKMWLCGGTLCYTRTFWNRNPFPDVDVGEDTRFVWSGRAAKAIALADNRFYVALIHAQNTSRKRTSGGWWHAHPIQEIREITGTDWDDLQALGRESEVPKPVAGPVPVPSRPVTTAPTPSGSGVTVSIPYFQCRAYIRRAVESILGQTHTDLTLVVVNDGDPDPPWGELAGIDDPRLVRLDLPANRGRYFADAVVLEATPDPYFAVQDADDWSEPERIARLLYHLRAGQATGALSAHCRHHTRANAPVTVERYRDINRPLTNTFEHRGNHQGLYCTSALRAIGGYLCGFRVGYDTLLINLLLMTGRLAYTDEPLYHRWSRSDSLSSSAATGMRSAARREVTGQLRQMYAEALRAYRAYLAGGLEHSALCAEIRRVAAQHVTGEDAAALQSEAERLCELLATRGPHAPVSQTLSCRQAGAVLEPAEQASRSAPVPVQHTEKATDHLIEDPRLRWSGWAVDKAVARRMAEFLQAARPQSILEIGSGTSTILLADYAARHRARLVSLGHESRYQEETARLLQEFGLRGHVDLRLAPLQPLACPDGRRYPWYVTDLSGPFDFVFIDGPPLRHGRQAVLFAIAAHLAQSWVAWLHDADREHEQQCVSLWRQYFAFEQTVSYPEPRGLYELAASSRPSVAGRLLSGLGISILTGDRLPLLQATIASLEAQNPGLLHRVFVVVLVNGQDPETLDYVHGLPFVDKCLQFDEGVLPIGDATSLLMRTLVEQGVEMILHLEDDWRTETTDPHWMGRAEQILRTQPGVGQVRLRHSDERVLPYHMITRQPIRWQRLNGFLLARSAHYTFNPSLIRASDVPRIFPCRTEHQAQINFLRAGPATAQLLPGVFRHIGVPSRRAALS